MAAAEAPTEAAAMAAAEARNPEAAVAPTAAAVVAAAGCNRRPRNGRSNDLWNQGRQDGRWRRSR
ncbi:hypothetical protein JMUB5695_04373 [Mycobacterium heckeshornense]|nr:hypothetical protein JMUB5695_04373 [Mycobacterium heckeshornense]